MNASDLSEIYGSIACTAGKKGAPPANWQVSGITRDYYLDLSEPLARQAVPWQDKDGRIVDPFEKEEKPTATARFVGALGSLIHAGRCAELAKALERSMEIASYDLFNACNTKIGGHAEFYVKELMRGYLAMKDKTDKATLKRWENRLGGYDPLKNYGAVFSKRKPEDIHNFATFALAGESQKRRYGISDNMEFMEKYIEQQKQFFTPLGMYRDPNDPMTYDYTSRMNLSLAEHYGYDGKNANWLRQTLRKGALAMLLYLSPTGEAPFGGRSNQQHFNEATIALICEHEASRAKYEGDIETAGMFKRAARLATSSISRWVKLSPIRDLKNSFHPESKHGRQKSYGFYSAYSLLIASQLGYAYLLADDAIEERPIPCELGGYILNLPGAFHKIFATCSGYHLEIDTRADFHYDATGLGRVHKKGSPSELALSTSLTCTPNYHTCLDPPPRNVAIGPGWEDKAGKTRWLSELSDEIEKIKFEPVAEETKKVEFRVIYKLTPENAHITIEEHYKIDNSGIEIESRISSGAAMVQVPLIETDGEQQSSIEASRNSFAVRYRGKTYTIACVAGNAQTFLEPFRAPNRNGIYRVGILKTESGKLKLKLTIEDDTK